MRTLVTVATLVQFFAASALGSCIVSWREMNCNFSIPDNYSQAEESPVRTCCSPQPACPVEKPKTCRDRTLVIWSILISLYPSLVPCCAHVSLAPELTDCCERQRAFDNSPDMAKAEPVLIDTAVQRPIDFFCYADPQGLPPPVSITILRC